MLTVPYTKICTVCSELKPFEEFYNRIASEDGKAYRCKECDNRAVRMYRALHKERYRFKARNNNLRFKYKLEPEDYHKISEQQNHVCVICHQEPVPNKQHERLVVDHDHKTGTIRGLLCHKCNQALGLFKENIETLKNAIKYLEKSVASIH